MRKLKDSFTTPRHQIAGERCHSAARRDGGCEMTDIVRYAKRCARVAPIGTMLAAALVTGTVMAQTMAQTMAPALDPEADAATIAPAEQLDFSLLIDAPTLSDHRNAAPPSDLAAPP